MILSIKGAIPSFKKLKQNLVQKKISPKNKNK